MIHFNKNISIFDQILPNIESYACYGLIVYYPNVEKCTVLYNSLI